MNTKNLSILLALSCIGAYAATNYDLLGRKGSQMNSPMVYKDVDYKLAQKGSFEQHILAKQGRSSGVKAIEGILDIHASYPNSFIVYNSSSKKTYTLANEYYTNFTPVYRFRQPSSSSLKQLAETNTGDSTTFPTHQTSSATSPYVNNRTINYYSYKKLLPSGSIPYYNNYQIHYSEDFRSNDDPIGVYIANIAEPAKAQKADNYKYVSLSSCTSTPKEGPEYQTSLATSALMKFSKHIVPFAINTSCSKKFQDNPENQYPQILIGLHIGKDRNATGYNSSTDKYSAEAKKLDNYIYDNHTVEIVGAGNFGLIKGTGKENTKGYLAAEAHAANAITVGAADSTNIIEATTSRIKPLYGGQKPEFYTYTNYNLGGSAKKYIGSQSYSYRPFIDGTSGAAIYTAAIVADLLRSYPQLRWHPEIVKARLLTSSDIEPADGGTSTDKILDFTKVFWSQKADLSCKDSCVENRNYSRFWNGDIKKFAKRKISGKDTTFEITFTVKAEKNNHYRAAIAWLNSGNDIDSVYKKYNAIPQDFDLKLYWTDKATKKTASDNKNFTYYEANPNDYKQVSKSDTGKNFFEQVSYTATKDGYLTFVIQLYKDRAFEHHNEVQLGFNLLSQLIITK